jgi:hypothetical protein
MSRLEKHAWLKGWSIYAPVPLPRFFSTDTQGVGHAATGTFERSAAFWFKTQLRHAIIFYSAAYGVHWNRDRSLNTLRHDSYIFSEVCTLRKGKKHRKHGAGYKMAQWGAMYIP